jgi:16S rRNA (uracil1498-N3)-methyltransferase
MPDARGAPSDEPDGRRGDDRPAGRALGPMPDGRGGPHVFVADLTAPEISDDDRHHLARVLRTRPGDAVTVSDGHGSWRPCRFGDVLEPVGEIVRTAPPTPSLAVGFALIKGGRPELVVQKLTELGIDRIVPFVAVRSVVRPDETRLDRQAERLGRVAREAAMQCRRTRLPEVAPLSTFVDLAAEPGVALAERDGRAPHLAARTVLVGPEGGWTDDERRSVSQHIGFGPQVLRAETAALAVAAVLGAMRAGLVAPIAPG